LEQALREQGVQVQWGHEIVDLVDSDEGVRVTSNELESELVPFVIGADGYNSRVRRALNLAFPEAGPAQQYAIFEIKTDADLDHELRIVWGDRTTDILWPLPDGYCRWAFEIPGGHFLMAREKDRASHSKWGDLPQLSEESIGTLLEERAPWFDGGVEKFTWRTLVRFERRLAPRFGQGRIWLVGDAAHLTGPAGVQSMNMGFLEGHDLAEAIARILNEGASLHSLEEYNRHCTCTWRQLLGLDGGLVGTPEADVWVSENAHRLLSCLPGRGRALDTLAGHLGLQRAGKIVTDTRE
jgi:2-polyprenyl-6-methoxyphenol hydroxylase-like FAD-dependent oxidoreductase